MKSDSVNGAFGAWLTKPEALSLLGKSDRSLDRLVAAGKVQRTTRARDGRSPEPLFHRADLERVTAVTAFEVQSERVDEINRQNAVALRRPPDEPLFSAGSLSELTALLNLVKGPAAPPVPVPPTLWCTVDEASERTGLSAKLLLRLIKGGKLPALRDGHKWKICRSDLHNIEPPADSLHANLAKGAIAPPDPKSRATHATKRPMARRAAGAT